MRAACHHTHARRLGGIYPDKWRQYHADFFFFDSLRRQTIDGNRAGDPAAPSRCGTGLLTPIPRSSISTQSSLDFWAGLAFRGWEIRGGVRYGGCFHALG